MGEDKRFRAWLRRRKWEVLIALLILGGAAAEVIWVALEWAGDLNIAVRQGEYRKVWIITTFRGVRNERFGYGSQPIVDAAYAGNVEIVKLLVSRGADLRGGLRSAAQHEDREMVAVLAEHVDRLSPEDRDRELSNALWEACGLLRADIVEILLEHGADPNGETGGEESLLSLVIGGGNMKSSAFGRDERPVVDLLLKYGADQVGYRLR